MLHRRYGFPVFFGLVLAFIGLAALFSPAQAAPAAPVDIPLTQPDGTTFTARQWGDEWLHGFETVDGHTILQAEDGAWVYAARGPDGQLTPVVEDGQALRVGVDAPPNLSLNARPDLPLDSPALEAEPGSPVRGQNSGNQRMLLVMVNFADRTRTYTPAYFQDKGFGASNSIKDFYTDASFGALNLLPAWETQGTPDDGMIEVTLGIDHPNDTNQSRTIATAVYNAIDPFIDFASFDRDGDGYVTGAELHFIMITAGYEESYGLCTSYCIWGHQWNLALPLLLDGKLLGTHSADGDYGGYAMYGEIHSNHPATIGIMSHELGHNLSWPDLYDTDNSSSGVGRWSIMGSGSWNGVSNAGDTPALPDAWLKWYQGWIFPTTAVNGQAYALDKADSSAEALLLGTNTFGVDWDFTKHAGTGEFFLAENRQYSGYDAGLPGCGILIWHIDETQTYTNSANAADTRPLVYLEQADGLNGMLNPLNRGDTGDPFPGSTSKTLFNDTSTPNSRYYNGASSNHSLTINTTSCSSAMTVSYSGPLPPLPGTFNKTLPANGATGVITNPTLTWGISSGADSYEYCIDTTNDNACSGWTSSGSSTSRALSDLNAMTTYYWQVRAVNGGGTTYANGSETAFWSFTTGLPPAAFGKSSPANGATDLPLDLSLSWGASSGATSYEYCIDTTNDNECFSWISSGSSTNHALSGLSANTTYYWHVRAINSGGTTYANGSASAFWSFNTLTVFTPGPVLWLPAIRDQQGYSGRVTYKGAAQAGKTIELYLTTNNWSSSTRIETTTTDSAGYYTFVLPPVGGSTRIGVQWVNPDNLYTLPQLTAWVCEDVSGLPGDKYTCNFDIQDIVLDKPAPGALISLPYTFRWFRRTTTSDLYEVDWWNSGLGHYMWTDKLPYASSFTLYGIPSYWILDYAYNWTVYAYGSNGAGIPYWYYKVYFKDRSSPPREGIGRTNDLLTSPDAQARLPVRAIQGLDAPEPRSAGERLRSH